MNIAIIPARGGSRRIPRKNIRLFHGRPIIAYSISTAQESRLFERVIVSTEDDEIAALAARYGAEVVRRPPELAEIGAPDCGTQEVARHALAEIGKIRYVHPEFACVIYATAPLMRCSDLQRAFDALRERPHAPFAYSTALAPQRDHGLRWDAGQFYWGRWAAFMARIPLNAEDVIKVVIPEDRVCDINTEEDWARAEQMYAALTARGEEKT